MVGHIFIAKPNQPRQACQLVFFQSVHLQQQLNNDMTCPEATSYVAGAVEGWYVIFLVRRSDTSKPPSFCPPHNLKGKSLSWKGQSSLKQR